MFTLFVSLCRRPRRAWLKTRRAIALLLLVVAALAVAPVALRSHEIPARVTVLVFVRADGQRVTALVRVPLEALRDLEIPLRGTEFINFSSLGTQVDDGARIWVRDALTLEENGLAVPPGRVVATRVTLPSDRAFETFERALASFRAAALTDSMDLYWRQALVDVHLEYQIQNDTSQLAVIPTFARLGVETRTVLRLSPMSGPERVLQFNGDPGLVPFDPGWWQSARQFVVLGFGHILDGIDHLLFLLCLVIPIRRVRTLIAVVTAFTLAHSLTLGAAAFGWVPDVLWFPPLIELGIALSIVYMALENIFSPETSDRRWKMAFAFGLVHGFGFSVVLRDTMQFAGNNLVTALFSFNIGVELGQVLVVSLAAPLLAWAYSRTSSPRLGTIVLSSLVAHTAWHWSSERFTAFREFPLSWPIWGPGTALALMRIGIVLLSAFAVAWLFGALYARFSPPSAPRDEQTSVAGV